MTRQERLVMMGSAAGLMLAAAGAWAARPRPRAGRPKPAASFRDQVVLITGGSRGFGLALARRFANEGARLALLARDPDQLAAAEMELSSAGAIVLTLVCDVRDRAAVRGAIALVRERLGEVDVLVNNAGVMHVAPIEHADVDDFRESLETHFWGPLYLIRECVPRMMRERAGHVVNISSVGGRIAVPHLAAYSVGKFALTALSEGLHAELKKYGVSVTTVTPHVMRTGSHRNVLVRGQHAKEALWFALASATPLTSIDADDAAREVVEAVKAGRATVTPGWQAQAAVIAKTAAPDLFADIAAWVSSALLPGATRADEADQARLSRDINLLFAARAFPTRASERFNQPVAEDERTWRAGPHDSAPSTGERHEVAQER